MKLEDGVNLCSHREEIFPGAADEVLRNLKHWYIVGSMWIPGTNWAVKVRAYQTDLYIISPTTRWLYICEMYNSRARNLTFEKNLAQLFEDDVITFEISIPFSSPYYLS